MAGGAGGGGRYDVIVVGGGVMGSWAAARVASRGASCALLDQFDPGHDRGSSHGDGRIYRFAYEEDIYVDMMELSLRHWKELQEHAKEPLMAETGGISMDFKVAPGSSDDMLGRLAALYTRRGLPHELLSAGALGERFPQFALLRAMQALYQPGMGVLFATKCVRAAWRFAASLGAELRPKTRVRGLSVDGDGVVLRTADGEELRARRAVLAPGAWITGLTAALLGLQLPTEVSAETVSYYAPRPGCDIDHSYRSMPVFISYLNNQLSGYGYYGLPSIEVPGVKVSAHFAGPLVDPEGRPRAAGGSGADPQEEKVAAARIAEVVASSSRFVEQQFPALEGEPFLSQNCLYTCTADHDYIIGPAPGFPAVILAGGGSGHAFKMGPAIGELCACLALQEAPPLAVGSKFAVERLLASGRHVLSPAARK